jgi:C-terminal processing protease CtpA/Prc
MRMNFLRKGDFMNRRLPIMIDPTWIGGIAGLFGALLVASLSLGQVPLPDVTDAASDTVQSTTQTAQDAAKSATDTATEATRSATDTASQETKSATDTARDATKSATDTARDATKSATDTARDAAKSGTKSARDAAKNAKRTGRDATKSATDTARDATESATDTARDATKSATDTARDATKSATDATRDATRRASDATRDAARNTTDAARDATKSATDSARDVTRSATDATRDATRRATDASRDVTDTARDVTRDATDAARDATDATSDAARDVTRDAARDVRDATQDAVRSTQDAARDATRNTRDAARDINRDVRSTVDDVRSTTRDASQSVIDQTRQSVRSDVNVRSNSALNLSSMRGADLGIWFDRSVRNGLVIADVAADAALAQVGFVEGDRIVSVNGRTVTAEQDFLRMILADNIRQPVNVVVMRGGTQETLVIDPVVIRERYTTVRTDPLERFGIILDDRIQDRLIVWRVIPRSPAFYAGIRAGDEITMFAGQRIADPTKFVQIVERTDPGMIPVQITRSGRVREIEVDFPQYQVSEQRTTYRQDLDAGVDANLNAPRATVRESTSADVEVELPAAPNSSEARPAQPRSSQPYYNNGSGYQRRGLFRRR